MVFCLPLQGRKLKTKMNLDARLKTATTKNVKTAILLSPGPVANHLTTRSLNAAFKVAVNKARFKTAAVQLETDGFGSLIVLTGISSSTQVFVKKLPSEVARLLETTDHGSMCSLAEYEQRFNLETPAYINDKMQVELVKQGFVAQHHFKQKVPRYFRSGLNSSTCV